MALSSSFGSFAEPGEPDSRSMTKMSAFRCPSIRARSRAAAALSAVASTFTVAEKSALWSSARANLDPDITLTISRRANPARPTARFNALAEASGRLIANCLQLDIFAANRPQLSGHTAILTRAPSAPRSIEPARLKYRQWARSRGGATEAWSPAFRPWIEPAGADHRCQRSRLSSQNRLGHQRSARSSGTGLRQDGPTSRRRHL